jgi:hypothetical protein
MKRIDLECTTDGQGRHGVQMFIPAERVPELVEALESAADEGEYQGVDKLLVQLDKQIKRAAKRDFWAKELLAELAAEIQEREHAMA